MQEDLALLMIFTLICSFVYLVFTLENIWHYYDEISICVCFKNLVQGLDVCVDNTIGSQNNRIIGISFIASTLDIAEFKPGDLIAKCELIKVVDSDISVGARIDIYKHIISSS